MVSADSEKMQPRKLFVFVVCITLARGLPTTTAETAKVQKEEKQSTGLLASAKKFFMAFHKVQAAHQKGYNSTALSGMSTFLGEFKKMNTWHCARPGHEKERMCMVQKGIKFDKSTPVAKATSIVDMRTAFCAVEEHKPMAMCKLNGKGLFGSVGMFSHVAPLIG